MSEIHYSILLQKVRDMTERWRYRVLTPIGRIQVINSLIVAQTTFMLMCLPSPTAQFFEEHKDLIIQFLWKGKGSKI